MDERVGLRGIKAALFGWVLLAITLGLLQLTHGWTKALTGGSCDGGSFSGSPWETILPSAAMVWLVVLVVEQALPETWRKRDLNVFFTRAVGSLTAWAVAATLIFYLISGCS